MKFEDLLSEINGFGRFQKMVLCINFFGRFSLACHFLLGNFIAVIPSHHCSISSLDVDEIFENLTQEERLTVSIPVQDDGTPASCHMFSYPQFHLLSNFSSPSEVAVVQCQNGWEYDNSTFISTLATQWDLVCDKRALSRLTTTIFFIGVMFGAAAFGSLSAMFGRKPMLLVSHMLGMGFGLCSAFSSSFIMFAVLRFFTGFTITGSVIISTILNVEWVSIKHRKLVGVIDSLSWTFAFMSFPLVAYFIRDWRWLTVAISLPTVTAIITWWWVPESARWLIANGRVDKAHYYLHKCAVMNRKKEVVVSIKPENLAKIIVIDRGNRKYSYLDLVRTPKMRKLALLTGITWFAVATVAYGISFNISSFGLNRYLTQFVYGAIEIPAKLSIYYLLDKFGRRITQAGSLLFVGISLMINIFIPKDKSVARTVIAVLGKGCSATSFGTVILYSSELYPTVVRQNGMGYNSFVARLGVSVAPLILLSDDVWNHFSQVILSSLGLSAAFVAYLLPETRGRCLPETIEDVEGIRKGTDDLPLQDQKMDEKESSRLKWKDNLIVQNT
ncbi:solute carrier family 22 member 7 [Sinocyclocheilus rhinocerous]|uniref:solute carrier family 22 member 7 n=1 Tax=Sinocyclocheilus rhinocerous TaxID=307959 RepID=UPI0007BA53C1|nr:PREDICTED: solute carrier family 22 member 7-like [Sinocyclocheilus rhinocerous]